MMLTPTSVVLLLALVPAPQTAAPLVPGGQPPCPIAEDEQYAYTREQPVQVGGSPLFGAARQRRYLDALRGPDGQRVQYKRRGQDRAPDGTILDAYEVTYEGLEKPVTLFLDWYHYNPQKAPRGFTCGQPFNLGPPPVDPFQEAQARERVAVAQGPAREFKPIPLGSDGETTHGVIYDRFRILARAARAAAAAGKSLDPASLPRELTQHGMVIVAYPLPCGDRTIRPIAIDVLAANGRQVPERGQVQASGAELAQLVSGLEAPDGSVGMTSALAAPRGNDTVRITYAETCGGGSDQVSLRMSGSPPRGIDMPMPPLPEGAPADQPVLLQVLVDTEGKMQEPIHVGGPEVLRAAAIGAIGRWQSQPARINGAPVVAAVLVQVRFVPAGR